MQRKGTYSGGPTRPTVHIGDSGTGLDRMLPAAKKREEQLWDRVTAVVRLQRGEERSNKLYNTSGMKTGEHAGI